MPPTPSEVRTVLYVVSARKPDDRVNFHRLRRVYERRLQDRGFDRPQVGGPGALTIGLAGAQIAYLHDRQGRDGYHPEAATD
jgi:hypothetical protein